MRSLCKCGQLRDDVAIKSNARHIIIGSKGGIVAPGEAAALMEVTNVWRKLCL